MNKLLVIILIGFSHLGFSAEPKPSHKSNLSTEMHFSGLKVKGRYNSPGETSIVIEDEKKLNNLITIRKHFRDRIKEEMRRD